MKLTQLLIAVTAVIFIPAAHAQYYGSSLYGNSKSGSQPKRAATPSYGTGSNYNSNTVQGHTRKDGTYVAPHTRSKPDSSVNNNWSTKGNTNPYTGASGTKRGNPYGR